MKKLSFKTKNLLLTGMASVGVIATGVSAAMASFEAAEKLRMLDERMKTDLVDFSKPSTWEKIKTVAPCYVWSAVFGASTICAIAGMSVHSLRTNNALVSAYGMLNQAYNNYREKNIELNGKESDLKIIDEMAWGDFLDMRCEEPDPFAYAKEDDIIMFPDEDLFYDEYSGRFFKSTIPEVESACCIANEIFMENGYIELNEIYSLFDIPTVEYGDNVGWSESAGYRTHGYTWVHMEREERTLKNGLKYWSIRFPFPPTIDYLF